MKSYYQAFSVLIMLILASCSNRNQFWDIAKFNIVPNAIADSQTIKLIYCSNGPDIAKSNKDYVGMVPATDGNGNPITPVQLTTDYYLQYVVVDLDTKDTFNVLTPEAIELFEDEGDQLFRYIKHASQAQKLMYNLDKLKDGVNIDSIKMEMPEFKKVARDKKFDFIADNNFKTVFGFIERIN